MERHAIHDAHFAATHAGPQRLFNGSTACLADVWHAHLFDGGHTLTHLVAFLVTRQV